MSLVVHRARRVLRPSTVLAVIWCLATLAVVVVRPDAMDLSVVVIWLAGLVQCLLIGRAVRYADGMFDPLVWLECFALWFNAGAPLTHIALGRYIAFVMVPTDWRPWLGYVTACNLFGSIVRFALLHPLYQRRKLAASTSSLAEVLLNDDTRRRALRRSNSAVGVTVLALLVLLVLVRGPVGFLDESLARFDGFRGLGSFVLLSDVAPLALLCAFVVRAPRINWARQRTAMVGVLGLLLVLQFVLSGLRGSRIQLVFFGLISLGMLQTVGLTIRKSALVAAVVMASLFSLVYTGYKYSGSFVSSPFPHGVAELALGDFGRSDIQAAVAWKTERGHVQLARGRTYASDAVAHIPTAFRPMLTGWSKADYGTTWFVGSDVGDFRVGSIYGAAGEAMMNFGPLAAYPALVVHGLIVCGAMAWIDRRRRNGVPVRVLYACLVVLLITALMSDLDQVIYMFLRFCAVPFFVFSRFGANKQLPINHARRTGDGS
jgi:hypothetical protein